MRGGDHDQKCKLINVGKLLVRKLSKPTRECTPTLAYRLGGWAFTVEKAAPEGSQGQDTQTGRDQDQDQGYDDTRGQDHE